MFAQAAITLKNGAERSRGNNLRAKLYVQFCAYSDITSESVICATRQGGVHSNVNIYVIFFRRKFCLQHRMQL